MALWCLKNVMHGTEQQHGDVIHQMTILLAMENSCPSPKIKVKKLKPSIKIKTLKPYSKVHYIHYPVIALITYIYIYNLY